MKLTIHLQTPSEPAWSAKIDRWYQLDEVGYSFCEALHQWNYLENEVRPDLILLALPKASNLADIDFVSRGAASPAKFVFTLPNICGSVILQMLGFNGKVYCLNQGENTIPFAKQEAQEFAKNGKTVWLFATTTNSKGHQREVEFQAFPAYCPQ